MTLEDLFANLAKCNLSYFSQEYFKKNYHQLAKIIYPTPSYQTFNILKKSGGHRTIDAPAPTVKELQQIILKFLKSTNPTIKPAAHGFVEGKSILSNADLHAGKNFLFNIDLKDFFHSINFGRIQSLLQYEPFSLSQSVATVLAHGMCKDGRLPQGAPTSPFISNIVCRKLDAELTHLAKRNRATYSRYCDDITFSFTTKNINALPRAIVYIDDDKVCIGHALLASITKNGFEINQRKVRLYGRSTRQEVTGITVNEFPNIKRAFIDEVRMLLHSWEVHGLEKSQAHLDSKRIAQKKSPAGFINFTLGKIQYLKMIRGDNDFIYRKLAKKYNSLALKTDAEYGSKLPRLKFKSLVARKADIKEAVYVIHCCSDDYMNESFGTCFS